jgi:hypothetical protein
LLACLIVAPQRGYDEPAILSYAISSFCPTSADGLQDEPAILSYAISSFCPTSADGLQSQDAVVCSRYFALMSKCGVSKLPFTFVTAT